MKRFIIHGREQQYHGQNGIENFEVVEFTTESDEEVSHELELAGEQLSIDVMESYSCIMEDLEAQAHETFEDPTGPDEDSDYDEILEDIVMENVGYTVYKLNDDMDKYSLEELNNMDPSTLIENATIY